MNATFILPKGEIPAPSSFARISHSQLEKMLQGLPITAQAKEYRVILCGPTDFNGVIIGMCIDLYPNSHTDPCQINRKAPTIARVGTTTYDQCGALSFHYSMPWHGYKITIHRH